MWREKGVVFKRASAAFLVFAIIVEIGVTTYMVIDKERENRRFLVMAQVVSAIRNRMLNPDQRGDIVLPSTFARASANGHVYVCRDLKEPFILFPTDVQKFTIEWGPGGAPNANGLLEYKLRIFGYVYATHEFHPAGWAVAVDDPAVDQVFVGHVPRRQGWFYAEPWVD